MKKILVLSLLGVFCFGGSVNAIESECEMPVEQPASLTVKYTFFPGDSVSECDLYRLRGKLVRAPEVDKMDLSNKVLNKKALKEIGKISRWTGINEIDLSNCNLDDEKVEFLAHMIFEACEVRKEISGSRMRRLVLSGNKITDQGCKSLLRILQSHVMSIVLDNNPGIGDMGARQLFATSLIPYNKIDWVFEPVVSFENCSIKDAALLRDIKDLKDAVISLEETGKEVRLARGDCWSGPADDETVKIAEAKHQANYDRVRELIDEKAAKYILSE